MKQPWDAIVWWEIRRIPFNLAVLTVGIVSVLLFAVIGSNVLQEQNIGSPLLEAVFYMLAANLCYTLGWITEILWSWGRTTETAAIRPKVFRLGLALSAALTLLPVIVISLVWLAHRFR